ncbi:MAG: TRAP transporter small permease subunit, partial [Pseudomonadota bacterium]
AVWDYTHFDVRVLPDAKRPLSRLLQVGIVDAAIMLFGILFVVYGIEYAEFGGKQRSVMMRANLMITHIAVPIAGAIWTLLAGYRLWEEILRFVDAQRDRGART